MSKWDIIVRECVRRRAIALLKWDDNGVQKTFSFRNTTEPYGIQRVRDWTVHSSERYNNVVVTLSSYSVFTTVRYASRAINLIFTCTNTGRCQTVVRGTTRETVRGRPHVCKTHVYAERMINKFRMTFLLTFVPPLPEPQPTTKNGLWHELPCDGCLENASRRIRCGRISRI